MWPPLTSTAPQAIPRDQEAAPAASAPAPVATGWPASAPASVALGVTSVARRSSGSSSAGSPSHSAPPREVASTGSTTTGPA